MKLFSLLAIFTISSFAQAASVTLNWQINPANQNITSVNYNVYRNGTVCPATAPTTTAGFTKVNSASIPGLTFTDSAPFSGTSCYFVTAVFGSVESAPSNTVSINVVSSVQPPLNVTIKQN